MAEKRKLTDSECELLISEVQSRSVLWNDRHSNFKNSVITRKLWEEIGKSLNLSGDECKKKWKNLKDTYRKKVSNPPLKSGSAASSPKKIWKFASLMEFTRDIIMPSPMVGNLDSSSMRDEDTYSRDTETQEYTGSDLQQESTSSCPEEEERFSRPHRPIRNIKKKEDIEKRMIELEEKKLHAILNMTEETHEKGDDYHFLMSLLPYIGRLDPLEKQNLRNKIQNCVIEAVSSHEAKKGQPQNTPTSSHYESSSSSTFDLRQDNSFDQENPQPQDTHKNYEFNYLFSKPL